MIAQRIYSGETAEQIGIIPADYASRKATLDRYLEQSGGEFDRGAYSDWLQQDAAGDRGDDWHPGQPSRGLGDTVAKVTHRTGLVRIAEAYTRITGKDCGCSRRQKTLNRVLPYKAERV